MACSGLWWHYRVYWRQPFLPPPIADSPVVAASITLELNATGVTPLVMEVAHPKGRINPNLLRPVPPDGPSFCLSDNWSKFLKFGSPTSNQYMYLVHARLDHVLAINDGLMGCDLERSFLVCQGFSAARVPFLRDLLRFEFKGHPTISSPFPRLEKLEPLHTFVHPIQSIIPLPILAAHLHPHCDLPLDPACSLSNDSCRDRKSWMPYPWHTLFVRV